MLFRAIKALFKPASPKRPEYDWDNDSYLETGIYAPHNRARGSGSDSPVPMKTIAEYISDYKASKATVVPNKICVTATIITPSSSAITPSAAVPEWFCVAGIQQSPAELKLLEELSRYRVEVFSEVAFREFKSSENGYYRFDFFIPSKKLIIEYDSKLFHSDPIRSAVDDIKTAWCWNKGITIRRVINKEYYSMTTVVADLMKNHNVRLK